MNVIKVRERGRERERERERERTGEQKVRTKSITLFSKLSYQDSSRLKQNQFIYFKVTSCHALQAFLFSYNSVGPYTHVHSACMQSTTNELAMSKFSKIDTLTKNPKVSPPQKFAGYRTCCTSEHMRFTSLHLTAEIRFCVKCLCVKFASKQTKREICGMWT